MPAFPAGNRLAGPAVFHARTCLHLHEAQNLSRRIEGDQIDLAEPAPVVIPHDPISLFLEIKRRSPLTVCSQRNGSSSFPFCHFYMLLCPLCFSPLFFLYYTRIFLYCKYFPFIVQKKTDTVRAFLLFGDPPLSLFFPAFFQKPAAVSGRFFRYLFLIISPIRSRMIPAPSAFVIFS